MCKGKGGSICKRRAGLKPAHTSAALSARQTVRMPLLFNPNMLIARHGEWGEQQPLHLLFDQHQTFDTPP